MAEIENVRVGSTTYDILDKNSVHTINGVAPTNGELSVTNGLSIVNGKLCITYVEEVEE